MNVCTVSQAHGNIKERVSVQSCSVKDCLFIIYKQATTKLACHSNETSKDKLSIIYNWLSIIVIQVHVKLHKNLFISTLKHKIVVEKLFKLSTDLDDR